MSESSQASPAWQVLPQGDHTLILSFGSGISQATGQRCLNAAARLRTAALAGVLDIVPTFNSVALHYQLQAHSEIACIATLIKRINTVLLASPLDDAPATSQIIEIPVCYEGEYAPDLDEVAAYCHMTPADVIALHSSEPVTVFMLGFAPGAPYMGLHDARLSIGRRATPRTIVPAGSIAIANRQSIVYPNDLPGGWQIIGATPVRMFDPDHTPPTRVAPGDRVRFVPIDTATFKRLKGQTP